MGVRTDSDPMASEYEDPPILVAIVTYFQFAILILAGRLRDLLHRCGIIDNQVNAELESTRSFVPVLDYHESFFFRNFVCRALDCLNRPLSSGPSADCDVMDRVSKTYANWELTGRTIRAVNLGSYNYLGFAENRGYCSDRAADSIRRYGVCVGSTRQEVGNQKLHRRLEADVAAFVGKEAAMVFGMGFGTNSLNIPALVGPGCCVISDCFNHASLVLGIRLSGAEVKRFKHNNMADLERCLEEAVVKGQRRTRRSFRKVLIVVEGIYSMEGTILNLPEVVRLKKKYRAYLFVDEAHSIGALGPRGRGVVDYFGMDPAEVDILMGTFSKSFGSAGGYIAASRQVVDYLRAQSHASAYGATMQPAVAEQVVASMSVITGKAGAGEGMRRVRQLARNCRHFRRRLHEMRFIVYGHRDSPVVPVMLFKPVNFPAFSRMMLERGVAVVVVGFPAAPLLLCRVRFCLSAGHTRAMLDRVLEIIGEVGGHIGIRVSKWPVPKWCSNRADEAEQEEEEQEVKTTTNGVVRSNGFGYVLSGSSDSTYVTSRNVAAN